MPNKRKRRSHSGYKARLLTYKTEGRAMRNKKEKLEKHIKENPNDLQAQEKPKKVDYTRKKPLAYWEKWNADENSKKKRRNPWN